MAKITAPSVTPDVYALNSCCIFFQGYQTMAVCNPNGSSAVFYDITTETRLEVVSGMLNVGGSLSIGTIQVPNPNYNMIGNENLFYNRGIVIGTGDVRNYTGDPVIDFFDLSVNPITVMFNTNHICQVKYIAKNNTTFIP